MSAPTSVTLQPPAISRFSPQNPLPQVLHTPSGLALLELQGTFNLPSYDETSQQSVSVGRLEFPDYIPGTSEAYLGKVYMFVGEHQRLTGEVKKLPKAVAVVRRRAGGTAENAGTSGGEKDYYGDDPALEDLEIMEIVKYKMVFGSRPEPAGSTT